MSCFLYILKSGSVYIYYTGISVNAEERCHFSIYKFFREKSESILNRYRESRLYR
jgi:predicted GIY-YIG superfamily endonuclease